MKTMYDVVKEALIERGWGIDPTAVERKDGELHEFIHPVTGKKMGWIDALLEQSTRDSGLA